MGIKSSVTLASPKLEPALPAAAGPCRRPFSTCWPAVRHSGRSALSHCRSARPTRTGSICTWRCMSATRCTTAGFAGVDPRWEWNPALLALRSQLEDVFLEAVRLERRRHRRRRARRRRDGCPLCRAGRRHRPVLLPARRGHLGADAGVLRAPLALPPQGRRSARLGHPPADRPGEGVLRRHRVRRVRRRARRPGASAAVRRPDGRRGAGCVVPRIPRRRARASPLPWST